MHHIWKKGQKIQLSKHFNSSELECKCKLKSCVDQTFSKVLLEKLEQLRTILGVGLSVSSGFRCSSHNVAIGGAKRSNHTLGNACDLKMVPDLNKLDLSLLEKLDLYMEDPAYTKSWRHVQTTKTRSGKRIFSP